MKLTSNIDVSHLTRVEGHGNIKIRFREGRLTEARWEVVETPRFFEALLVGKSWRSAPVVTGRICGICSIGHTLASIRAVENSFSIRPSEQTARLRLLLKHMETLQSHVLHLYFLAAPDFLGQGSVLPLIETAPEVVARAAGLKKLANDGADIVGGRRLHPTTTIVGGFTDLPDKRDLESLRQGLESSLDDLNATVELFKSFNIPDFTRQTEYVSLKGKEVYPFIGGDLVSTDGVERQEHEYLAMTNEYTVEQSTSKWCRLSRDSYAVGALARVNNNFDLLHKSAQAAASHLELNPVCHNPFMNNAAQLVECIHVVEDSISQINEHLDATELPPSEPVTYKSGSGVAAVEVPRGILYHSYSFDEKGTMTACDCVIPTGQNHANIQLDLEALAAIYAGQKDDKELELLASMLVRSYDPCISCSVH